MDAQLAVLLLLFGLVLVALNLPIKPEPPPTRDELVERQYQIDRANHVEML